MEELDLTLMFPLGYIIPGYAIWFVSVTPLYCIVMCACVKCVHGQSRRNTFCGCVMLFACWLHWSETRQSKLLFAWPPTKHMEALS